MYKRLQQVSQLVMAVFLLSVLIVCTGSEPAGKRETPDNRSKKYIEEAVGPCDILSDEFLATYFDIGDAQITRRPSKYSPHPLCIVTWPLPNAAEIEAQNTANMAAVMQAQLKGDKEAAKNMIKRTTSEVNLTINKEHYENTESAVTSFEAAMTILRDGMEVEVKGEKKQTRTYELSLVTGTGDKAYWVEGLNQLSMTCSGKIYHLGVVVSDSDEENRDKAIEMSARICEML